MEYMVALQAALGYEFKQVIRLHFNDTDYSDFLLAGGTCDDGDRPVIDKGVRHPFKCQVSDVEVSEIKRLINKQIKE
jgi:hypothetical protein